MNSRELCGRGGSSSAIMPGSVVANAQFVFVDQRIVNAVDVQLAQLVVVQPGLESLFGNVMAEAQAFEEILIDNVRPGADDAIDHPTADHLDEHTLQPGADQRTGQAQNDAAFLVAQHAIVNFRRPSQIAGGVRHVPHRVDQADHVVAGDVDVLNGLRKQRFLAGAWQRSLGSAGRFVGRAISDCSAPIGRVND